MIPQSSAVVAVELVVESLDRALELMTQVLGFPLVSRGPSVLIAGEMATVDAGGCLLTLLEPAASGDGTILAERSPRLSQLVIGVAPGDLSGLHATVISSGLASSAAGSGFFITPEAAAGALGQPVAVVVTAMEDPE